MISSGYLSQIEGGKRGRRKRGGQFAPHPEILRRLAYVYHVPARALFERAGFLEDEHDDGFSEEREVDRYFDFVIADPVLKKALTTADKRAIIERYEVLTRRRLITWSGESGPLTEGSGFLGLSSHDDVLHADCPPRFLTIGEVATELGISPAAVRQLMSDGYLRGSEHEIPARSVIDLKVFLINHGLCLTLGRAVDPSSLPDLRLLDILKDVATRAAAAEAQKAEAKKKEAERSADENRWSF